MNTPSHRYVELARLPGRELERLLASSKAPELKGLAGWEWRGYNTPWTASVLGIRKFVKGFFQGPAGLEGYNIPVRQNGLGAPWAHVPDPDRPKRFGFYLAAPVAAGGRDALYPGAALLDYGASPRNPWWRVERLLRDYLVQPDRDNPDILLGKAYLALGARLPASYFVLERLRPTDWRP